jgi:hypothetical protein
LQNIVSLEELVSAQKCSREKLIDIRNKEKVKFLGFGAGSCVVVSVILLLAVIPEKLYPGMYK